MPLGAIGLRSLCSPIPHTASREPARSSFCSRSQARRRGAEPALALVAPPLAAQQRKDVLDKLGGLMLQCRARAHRRSQMHRLPLVMSKPRAVGVWARILLALRSPDSVVAPAGQGGGQRQMRDALCRVDAIE